MRCRGLLLVLLLCLYPAQGWTQSSGPSDEKTGLAQKEIEAALVEAANEYLGDRFPAVKLRYIDNSEGLFTDGMAIDYDWKRSWSSKSTPDEEKLSQMKVGESAGFAFRSFNAELYAKGSYAEDDVDNDRNLSVAGAALSMEGSIAPWRRIDKRDQAAIQSCNAALDVSLPKAEFDAAAQICFDRYTQVAKRDGMAYGYSLNFHYEREGDQHFSETQEVYGGKMAFVLAPQPDSPWRNINIPDFPFRFVTRELFGSSRDYVARLPSVLVALQQVDPKDNQQRMSIDPSGDKYSRFYTEIAFSTQVAHHFGLPVTFEASYQVYHELDAPEPVEAAGLDVFEYFAAAVYFPVKVFDPGTEKQNHEIFFRYTSGSLPFDVADRDAMSFGWKTSIDTVMGLLFGPE